MAGFPNTTTYGTGAGSQPLITCYVGAAGSQINFKSGAGQDPACPYSIVRTGYYVQVSGTYTAT
jgi:L,D-peptidoglycan transpeptidase YkuD (ErfK/YbiS/YcfS/YnhG family)